MTRWDHRHAGVGPAAIPAKAGVAVRQLKLLDAEMAAVIAADAQLAADAKFLTSIPGVGPVAVAAALAYIDFARFASASQVAAYRRCLISRARSPAAPTAVRASTSRARAWCAGCCIWRRYRRRAITRPSSNASRVGNRRTPRATAAH